MFDLIQSRRAPSGLTLTALWILWLAGVGGCNEPTALAPVDDDGANYWPGSEWRSAEPGQLGFDQERVDGLLARFRAGSFGQVHAVVVVRYGFVAVEAYRNWSPNISHTLQSVTKSITSLLVGIAEGDGSVQIDRPVLEYFPEYQTVANLDDRKRALTVADLLTMRTGMDFWEYPYPGSPLDQLNRSTGDWVRLVLDRPMLGSPGQQWAYNSGGTIVLAGLLRNATGQPVDRFARERLFDPLGITSQSWCTSPYDGLPHTGGGLSLTPKDLARIGYLVLRGGRWTETQVVPADWIARSTASIVRAPRTFGPYQTDYGYLWWPMTTVPNGAGHRVITASGAQGQWLLVVPDLDLVVAIVSDSPTVGGLDLFYDGILQALQP